MDSRITHKEIPFSGKLITSEPASIGVNFRTLTNMRYTDTHIKNVDGMTKINSTALSTYLKTRNAFHFKKYQPAESHLLIQAYNTGLTASQILDNTTAIPSAGDFSGTALHTDTSGAGRGYFSEAPDGQMIYANGVDTCIWGGSEVNEGAVILTATALASASSVPDSPKDYTNAMNNLKTDAANKFTCGGGYLSFLIGSTRPAKGAKIYVSSANASANTLVVKESTSGAWNALAVTADNTRLAGKTFAQTGLVSWASTVSTTKPKYIEGYYLYWYQFTIDAGSADIYRITLDLPFQNIIDMWDGIYRDITRFYVYTTSQADNTLKVLKDDYYATEASSYADISSLVATNQYLENGFGEKQTGLYFAIPPDYTNTDAAAVAAKGTITMGGISVAEETFVIGAQTFTWKAARGGVGEVTVGAAAAAACANIVTAVGLDLATVTAALGAPDTVIITAVTVGVAGNSINFSETSTNMTMDDYGGEHLGGTTAGVDGAGVASVDYWNGVSWSTVGDITDGTAVGGVPFAKSGVISWNNTALASEQLKQYANAIPLYYYKVKFSSNLDASVRLNYVAGISASKEISYYKFPVFAQGRVLLCCDMAGDKSKAVCSSKYMPQVYNGIDSVDIYFGADGELTCGTELFSQFGSSLYSLVLMFKDNETWVMAGQDINAWADNTFLLSSSIGCPAPQTLRTINLAAEPGAGINKALAIWQGASGVYMSDGRAPIPIHNDINAYFDPSDSRYVGASLIGESVAFVDHTLQEYHLLLASGAELVYDIHRNKWFEIDRGVDLKCGVAVHDTDGNAYCYGFLDTGYCERLENGTTFDGTTITHTLQFGDFPLGGLAVETRLSNVKLITVAKTNDITLTHYSDTSTTGTAKTMAHTNSGYRLAFPQFTEKLNGDPFHSFKLETTAGFEPLALIATAHPVREDN
jgi:hypothetical protein